ncbi:RNA-induced silencing complex, nuclease component Tudor-SN [Artemisia annua]|uniref:RNA-induced silencing complex, nuclease component Tudor-SN n=1 Tax=Artemisia annua TaxID=35608 RepID=A0A2U1LLU4_ARTAN|nr:RNA-induced silencing complex, nuclease component Tudor-SN [Artemisia annua]
MHLLASNKGKPMEAIVEQVCDGILLRVYMLPEFQFGQSPLMGRTTQEPTISNEVPTDEPNGDSKADFHRPLTSLNVHMFPEGIDNFSNMIRSVYYADGELDKDLAMELLENGYAKYVKWTPNLMEHDARMKLKAAKLQANRTKLRLWVNYVLPTTNTNVLCENFTGKVGITTLSILSY